MYDIIHADPPWNYTAFSNKIPSRSKEGQPYLAMRMIDIYEFAVPPTNADAVLFLWTTSPLLPEALYTMKRWGFEYKTVAFTWNRKTVHSVIESPIEEHSKKPDIIRDKIVELCGDKPRIEMFARAKYDGWDCVGNQVE